MHETKIRLRNFTFLPGFGSVGNIPIPWIWIQLKIFKLGNLSTTRLILGFRNYEIFFFFNLIDPTPWFQVECLNSKFFDKHFQTFYMLIVCLFVNHKC